MSSLQFIYYYILYFHVFPKMIIFIIYQPVVINDVFIHQCVKENIHNKKLKLGDLGL